MAGNKDVDINIFVHSGQRTKAMSIPSNTKLCTNCDTVQTDYRRAGKAFYTFFYIVYMHILNTHW